MQSQNDVVVLNDATKRFSDKVVVDHLTFTVPSGTIFGLIGPSGSGKTTAIRLILGVHLPDEGSVKVLNQEPRRFGARIRAKIGYLPQQFVLYPDLTIRENLNFVASCYGVALSGRSKRIAAMLDFVGLSDAANTLAQDASGGMQRRLGLACTLIHDPQVIVLDEPTAGIDPVLRQKFWEHFRKLRDEGRTLVITTQYATESEYCDTIAVMAEGKLITFGPPDDVRQSAMGGEVVMLNAAGLTRQHLQIIADIPGIHEVRGVSHEDLRITVESAGSATPAIVAALHGAGLEIGHVSEYRPNFDEVFVRLMNEHDARSNPDAGTATADQQKSA